MKESMGQELVVLDETGSHALVHKKMNFYLISKTRMQNPFNDLSHHIIVFWISDRNIEQMNHRNII